jgi:hypothetical protein
MTWNGQVNVSIDALQSMLKNTDGLLDEQAGINSTHNNVSSGLVDGGLQGVVRSSAISVGQEREGSFNTLHQRNQQVLYANPSTALQHYVNGQDSAHSAMNVNAYTSSGAMDGAINR